MSSLSLLTLVLGILMILVGGKQGLAAYLGVILNFGLLFLAVILIASGFNIIWICIFFGICILALTIYLGSHDERATNVAFVATLIVLGVMVLLIIPLDYLANTAGFANEQSEQIEAFNLLIGVDFRQLLLATTILSTLGALAEAAIAIASGLEELWQQNPTLTTVQLIKSGKVIGFQIMGMTFNTLFFGMFGSDLALFILLYRLKNTFGYYFNSKIFVAECMLVLYAALAVILVIWLTIYLMTRKLMRSQKRDIS
ncbi:YibE/F family protein [Ligilactobacillus sp. Marseille-Q7487]|uniref:YibE/F family protein n=1 Tax=Ligilactobacillus sp. Marseille-Q7487 TaxID=3022128 RepID=UPI0024A9AE55|nr:YibE/F family protein [Ligilactobacillus sp. Marseille-Q7487]